VEQGEERKKNGMGCQSGGINDSGPSDSSPAESNRDRRGEEKKKRKREGGVGTSLIAEVIDSADAL